jgi:purine-nucleoside phosphorylase
MNWEMEEKSIKSVFALDEKSKEQRQESNLSTSLPDLMHNKNYKESSVFLPENLLRESRRQKNIAECNVPKICVLDPDGDIVRYLKKNSAELSNCWACYHSDLYNAKYKDLQFGIIGCAVGASYAVLLAEQLFVSGCELLISITSAGKLNENIKSDYILIDDTVRDEGTSYHYLSANDKSHLDPILFKKLEPLFSIAEVSVQKGKSWTTDAPYRETQSSINNAKGLGADSVEMEASALYAFSKAKSKPVVCFAHLTNSMAQQNGDFEKGAENGSLTSLELIYQTTRLLASQNEEFNSST